MIVLLLLLLGRICFSCLVDEDCNLNGQCVNSKCTCDPGWIGTTCAVLNLLPAKTNTGYKNETQASWGGAPIRGWDGKYHLYTAQMINNCSLDYWTTNSVIIHAISDTIEGPYKYVEQVLQPWAHNPMPTQAPDGTYLIYHIGDGTPRAPIYNCSLNSIPPPKLNNKKIKTLPMVGQELNVNIMWSDTPTGPWYQHHEIYEDPADNPTAYFFPNGTVLLLHRIDIWANWTNPISQILLAVAKHWTGPYISHGGPIIFHQCEDPFIYRNNNGHFHALFHGMEQGYIDQKSYAGRHAFSRDGLHWTFSEIPAYNSTIVFANGQTVAFMRRERPQLYFVDGIPKYLWNGVQLSDAMPTWTFVQEIGW